MHRLEVNIEYGSEGGKTYPFKDFDWVINVENKDRTIDQNYPCIIQESYKYSLIFC